MMCGYFGKLPARSDFVSGRCPQGFLKVWEPFLMQGLAQSRVDLGGAWQEAYMTMPVWCFELSLREPDDAAAPVLRGALMPSVDGVGREFPLTVVAETDRETDEGAGGWFSQVETVLRSALYEDADLPGFQKAVAALPAPGPIGEAEIPEPQADLPAAPEQGEIGASRFWCRAGGASFSFRCGGLPHPAEFRWLLVPEKDRRMRAELARQGIIMGDTIRRLIEHDRNARTKDARIRRRSDPRRSGAGSQRGHLLRR